MPSLRLALSFDDVLLTPKFTNLNSRSEVNLRTSIAGVQLEIPVIAANMPSVCEDQMAAAIAEAGGLGIIHRMCSIIEQAKMVQAARGFGQVGAAIGIGDDWEERALACLEVGASIICLDVAHGHQRRVLDVFSQYLEMTKAPIIVGNVATNAAVTDLYEFAAEEWHRVAVKVGVGGGSVCTTRIQTGCGLPTLQSLLDIEKQQNDSLIADGGIRTSGDIVKSLATGAKAVMLGSLLAGTDEAPGAVIKGKDGQRYKVYRGAASYAEKKNFFGKAEYIEGEETLVHYKGPVQKVLDRLLEGVRSGFTYCGASNIEQLHNNAEFVQVTQAGLKESHPHGVL